MGRRLHVRVVLALSVAFIASACGPSWLMYHLDVAHTGADPSAPDIVPVSNAWSTSVDAPIYGEPLVYNNRVYVGTLNNTMYALNISSGSVVWSRHLGPPVDPNSVSCPPNVGGPGIFGTPVIDTATNNIFAVAWLSTPTIHHEFVGLDLDSGAVKVDVSADPAGVDPKLDHQRPALAISNGRVYWGYGGTDCGFYHGKVVSLKTDGTSPLVWTVPSVNYGSLWGASGPAIDPNGNVWVTTGDGTSTTQFDMTTSLIKLSPTLGVLGYFAPSNWSQLNTSGSELGSAGPLVLPNGYVFAAGKNQVAYIVSQADPGGIGGQAASLSLGCRNFGGEAYSAATGMVYAACPNGTRAISVTGLGAGSPVMHAAWTGPSDADGPPVIGGNTLWVMATNNGKLYALNPSTGAIRQTITIGTAGHFSTPTVANDTVIVATMGKVQAFRHQG